MNYWLHRITGGENAYPYAYQLLFAHNYLSIGWSEFSEDSFVERIKQNGEETFNEAFKDWGYPRNRWNLWRFIMEMKKGDIVVVPTPNEFSVYEICDDEVLSNESIDKSIYEDWNEQKISYNKDRYLYNTEGQFVDLGFYRRVKPIETNISREKYADQYLYSRMKIQQTNADISDLHSSIENAIEYYRQGKPINLKDKIVEETSEAILKIIRKYTNDSKFEDLVEWYLESLGAKIEKPSKNVSRTEEGDADRVGIFENIKTTIMVQVKKHEGDTDDWAIQQIKAFKKNHDYGDYFTQMWVISSCDKFSEEAQQLASVFNVRLINGLEFAKMILDVGLEGLSL